MKEAEQPGLISKVGDFPLEESSSSPQGPVPTWGPAASAQALFQLRVALHIPAFPITAL